MQIQEESVMSGTKKTTVEKETVRDAVRNRYGNVARSGSIKEMIKSSSCCGGVEATVSPSTSAPCCGSTADTVKRVSEVMGYSQAELDSVPTGANLGLGCGNPVAIASLQAGETVIDLGSGGGFDCFLAARKVGPKGRVIGVDMTPDMIRLARENAEKSGAETVEFRLGEIEHLPVADDTADVLISNCVINLSPDKETVYRDAFRVLKSGGRLSISDILTTAPLPESMRKDLNLVSACVGGAETIAETNRMLEQIGFVKIEIEKKSISEQLIQEWLPGSPIGEYVVSAVIKAVKP